MRLPADRAGFWPARMCDAGGHAYLGQRAARVCVETRRFPVSARPAACRAQTCFPTSGSLLSPSRTATVTFRFSGRRYPKLAWIVRALCAVTGRCC